VSPAQGSLSYFFWHSWDWDLSKIIGCIALVLVFGFWTRMRPLHTSALYVAGVAILFLSLASPLDALGDEYLFSAHMFQHFILLMIVPILMILGLPESASRSLLQVRWIAKTERALSHPVFAWILANLILWIWHAPKLYDLAVQNEGIHIFQHLTFLISATIFWWPVLAPTEESRLSSWAGIIYVFTAALSNMALGIALTFMDEPLYTPYLNPEDSWKILGLLRFRFHLDPLADQKLGGVVMWVLGSAVFLGVLLLQFSRWYTSVEMEQI
jgi:cytochrome c oxidase assembly factor CtaG